MSIQNTPSENELSWGEISRPPLAEEELSVRVPNKSLKNAPPTIDSNPQSPILIPLRLP